MAAASELFWQALALIERSPARSPELFVEEAEVLGGLRLSSAHDERVDCRALAFREIGCWKSALMGLGPAAIGEGGARAATSIGRQAAFVDDFELAGVAVGLLDDLLTNAEPPAELHDEFSSSAAAYVDARTLMADVAWANGESERSVAVLDEVVLALDLWGGYPCIGGWDRSQLRQATLVSRLLRRAIVVGQNRDELSSRCDALLEGLGAAFPRAMEQGDEDGAVAIVRLLPAAADHARATGRTDLVVAISSELEKWVEALAGSGGVAGQVLAGDLAALRTQVMRE